MRQWLLVVAMCTCAGAVHAQQLTAERLGVIYDAGSASSKRIAEEYVARRHVPAQNLVGITLPDSNVISRDELRRLRATALGQLPTSIQSVLLVWSKPYAAECMSITTAFAAGYAAGFCEPGCGHTTVSPLFNTRGWLPADTAGWMPAMLLPSGEETLARAVIEHGVRADDSHPAGIAYLIQTDDLARSVRAPGYREAVAVVGGRIGVGQLHTPLDHSLPDAIAYFTGAVRVAELDHIVFLPGAVADHLTSTGGVLYGGRQMSALEWLRQGATGAYGTVSEPCANPGKFPSPAIFLEHYLRGDTLMEAYWKSVAMPGQGLFIGEPLARPFGKQQ